MMTIAHSRLQDIVRPYLSIELGGQEFGLPLTALHEIVDLHAVTLMLQPPTYAYGFAARSGRTISVADLRRHYGLRATFTPATRIVIVWTRTLQPGRMQAGLMVDATGTLLTVAAEEIAPADQWREHALAEAIEGRCIRAGKSIPLLNPEKLLASCARREASRTEGAPTDSA